MDPQITRKIQDERAREFRRILEGVQKLPRPKLPYSKVPAGAFVTLHFYHRLLTHQSTFMILNRTVNALVSEGVSPEQIPHRGRLSLATVVKWSEDLKVKTLFQAYCIYPDPSLIAFIADIQMEGAFLDAEWARRIKNKPVAQEFIRLVWLGEQRYTVQEDFRGDMRMTGPLPQVLKVDKIGSHRPWEQDPQDIQGEALAHALELWSHPGSGRRDPGPLPNFPFRPEAMLPNEQEFWNGPMAQAWRFARPALIREAMPVLTGKHESIPEKVRQHLRQQWRTMDNQSELLSTAGTLPEEWPEYPEDNSEQQDNSGSTERKAAKAVRVVHRAPEPAADDQLASREEAAKLYRKAALKKYGLKFLEALAREEIPSEASRSANISRTTAHNYLKSFRKVRPTKKPLR